MFRADQDSCDKKINQVEEFEKIFNEENFDPEFFRLIVANSFLTAEKKEKIYKLIKGLDSNQTVSDISAFCFGKFFQARKRFICKFLEQSCRKAYC
jgi:hypothetical protein